MAGAKEVLALYNSPHSNGTGKPSGGIPWFAILDAKAKVLATSDGPKGNIGFPSTEDEIVHFVKMLNASKQLLTDADIDVLRTSLAAKKPSVEK